jgi:hypothetical protein
MKLALQTGATDWRCELVEGDCSSLDASQIDQLRFTKNHHQIQMYQGFLDDLHVVQRLTKEFILFSIIGTANC